MELSKNLSSDFYIGGIPVDTLRSFQSQISDGVAPNNSATNTSMYFGGSSNDVPYLDKTSFTSSFSFKIFSI